MDEKVRRVNGAYTHCLIEQVKADFWKAIPGAVLRSEQDAILYFHFVKHRLTCTTPPQEQNYWPDMFGVLTACLSRDGGRQKDMLAKGSSFGELALVSLDLFAPDTFNAPRDYIMQALEKFPDNTVHLQSMLVEASISHQKESRIAAQHFNLAVVEMCRANPGFSGDENIRFAMFVAEKGLFDKGEPEIVGPAKGAIDLLKVEYGEERVNRLRSHVSLMREVDRLRSISLAAKP